MHDIKVYIIIIGTLINFLNIDVTSISLDIYTIYKCIQTNWIASLHRQRYNEKLLILNSYTLFSKLSKSITVINISN